MSEARRQVFLYGSLLSSASLQRTIPGASFADGCEPLVLLGWARAWNVVSSRTFPLADDPDGRLHRRLVLGIHPDPAGRCEGVVVPLAADALVRLARRETAYELEPVHTNRHGELVWGFLPRTERTTRGPVSAEPLVVEQAYLDECRAGCAEHGLAEAEAELLAALDGLRVATAAS